MRMMTAIPDTPALARTDASAAQRTALALTLVRVVMGLIFAAHGYQKFFIFTLAGTTESFTGMGVPFPSLVALVLATLELFGGLALLLGLGTRVIAALLTLDMLGALFLVHLKAGFFNPSGVEFPLSLAAGTAALALAGPGAYALSSAFSRRPS